MHIGELGCTSFANIENAFWAGLSPVRLVNGGSYILGEEITYVFYTGIGIVLF